MKPAFTYSGSRVYRLTEIDPDFLLGSLRGVEIYIDVSMFDVIHAKVFREDNYWEVLEFGVSGRSLEEDLGDDYLHVFFEALEEHLDDAPLFLYPWTDEGERLLQAWKPDRYKDFLRSRSAGDKDACFRKWKRRSKSHGLTP